MGRKTRQIQRFFRALHTSGLDVKGGIESLMPGRISGWAVARGAALQEVRLLVGPNLIARAEIDQPRPDVCESLGWQGQPGFSLRLPGELPPLDWSKPARLLALSSDGSVHVELELIRHRSHTAERLTALLQSEALGLEGHCDGLLEGSIRGWAGRRGQRQPARIWLQTTGLAPRAVICDQWRDGLAELGLPPRCGFSVNPGELPENWSGLEVWCSFDQEGQFRLPQGQPMVLPASGSVRGNLAPGDPAPIQAVSDGGYHSRIEAAPEDLRSHWQALENFRLYLDGLEQELGRRERIVDRPATPLGWWTRLIKAGR